MQIELTFARFFNVMSVRALFALLLFICFAAVAVAQPGDSLTGFGIEGNFMSGRIIRHSAKFTAPIPAFSNAVEANFVWQTYGKKEWQQRRNFPQIGGGIVYTDYGLSSVFGRCVGLNANIQVPLARVGKLEWTCRFGIGMAYVTRKYQAYAPYDTINTAVSTHFNAFPVFVTDVRYHINKHWDVQLGANFTHISNALYSEPNLGVNMAGLHIGTRYFPVSSAPGLIVHSLPRLRNRFLVDVRGGLSYKHARAEGSPVLPTYIGALSLSRRWWGKNKWYVGVDYAYHHDVYAFLKNYGVDRGVERQNSWDGTFFVGNELMIGRVGIITQVGVYYHQTFLDFDPVMERIGIKYYLLARESGIFKDVYLSAILATHAVVAEYSEFGIGFAF